MAKEAVFTMKLEPELRDAFMAAAKRVDRPASQLMREMMREYVDHADEHIAYDDYHRRKVEAGLAELDAGMGIPSKDVEAFFAERRKEWARKSKGAA